MTNSPRSTPPSRSRRPARRTPTRCRLSATRTSWRATCTHPAGRNAVVFGQAFLEVGWHLHQGLVWVKDSMVLGHSDYHYQHEPIIYGWKKGANRTWLSDRTQVTVFAIDRPKASRDHPTTKPVELVIRQIGNNVPDGGVIFEPFCGSGTTLIAAEQMGLCCRAIELSPAYCQVTIDRWE